MQKKIILLIVLGMFQSLVSSASKLLEYEEPVALCIGDIVFHNNVEPDLCLYYKGNKLQLDVACDKQFLRLGQVAVAQQLINIVPYTLYETKATQEFHVLIASKPDFASDENTITYMYVPNNTSYKFYTLSAARQHNEIQGADECLWNIREDSLPDDRVIPDDTIIFLFNADYIQGLEVKTWPLNSNVRFIPSIVMKKTISPDDIMRAIIEARMIAVDFDTIHHHYTKVHRKIENKTVLMIKQ